MARAPKKKRRTRYLSPGRKMLLVAALLAVFALSSTLFLNFRAHRSEEGPENGEGFADPIQAYVMVGEGELTAPFYNEGFAVVDQFGRGTQVQLESWEPFLTESNEEYLHTPGGVPPRCGAIRNKAVRRGPSPAETFCRSR